MPLRFTPGANWSPLVISFPHVGLTWPHELGPKPQIDFARNSDYEVHRLYDDCADMGVASVAAVYSRVVVDLNRAHDDISHDLVPDHPAPRPRESPGGPASSTPDKAVPGRRVVWDHAVDNVRLLRKPLSYEEFQHRILHFHAPYHRALRVLLQRRLERFGHAVLLDAHSMPGSIGHDLVLGTLDGASVSVPLERAALLALTSQSTPSAPALRVQANHPYRGGALIAALGRPSEGVHALQLEINRALYMDERTLRLRPGARRQAPATDSPSKAQNLQPPPDPDQLLGPQDAENTAPAPAVAPDEARSHRAQNRLEELRHRVKCLIRTLSSSSLAAGGATVGT